jgi:hypothetical protein
LKRVEGNSYRKNNIQGTSMHINPELIPKNNPVINKKVEVFEKA